MQAFCKSLAFSRKLNNNTAKIPRGILCSFILFTACSDVKDDHDHDHDRQLMTTVALDFASTDGSEAFTATPADPEQSGSPSIDITLTDGQTYVFSVSF